MKLGLYCFLINPKKKLKNLILYAKIVVKLLKIVLFSYDWWFKIKLNLDMKKPRNSHICLVTNNF